MTLHSRDGLSRLGSNLRKTTTPLSKAWTLCRRLFANSSPSASIFHSDSDGRHSSNRGGQSFFRRIVGFFASRQQAPTRRRTTYLALEDLEGRIVPTGSLTLSSSLNPSPYTESSTFTALLNDDGVPPTGSITFYDGSTALDTESLDTSGAAAFTTSALSVGSHTITAMYNGDDHYDSITSGAVDQMVSQTASTTTLASSENSSLYVDSVTFSAEVSGPGVTPTGSVTFYDGSTALDTESLDTSGAAAFTTSALSVGGHTITAVYGSDGNYNSSTSSAVDQTVNQAASTITLASSENSSQYGDSVAFSAEVSGPGVTPTGNVTFYDGGTALDTASLDTSGAAAFTTSALSVGGHTITAVYGSDGNYNASTSSAVDQTVNEAASTITLASSENSSQYGDSVTFSAEVSGPGVTPTGTVTFFDGGTALGTDTLDTSGDTSFTTSALSVGSHTITAVYGGDGNYNSSTSSAVDQTVNQTASTTTLASSENSSLYRDEVMFSAEVSGSGVTPTGNVTFYDGSTALDTATLNAFGTAAFSTSALRIGSHSITAVYDGDENYNASTSSALDQMVNQRVGSERLARGGPIISMNITMNGLKSVTLSGTVLDNSASPAGLTVTFTGVVSATTTTDSSGNFTITTNASALGDVEAATVDGLDHISNTATVTVACAAPVISNFTWSSSYGVVIFTGTVTCPDASGMVITIQGSPTRLQDGVTTTATSNGTFSWSFIQQRGDTGDVGASCVDCWGQQSNVAITFLTFPS